MSERATPETDAFFSGQRFPHYAAKNFAKKLERARDALAEKFTKLDKPKYSGEPMLDEVLRSTNTDFRDWVASLPPTYWTRYDLSAARIGWEAACDFMRKQNDGNDGVKGGVRC